ncbi:MAG: hypothetical protein NZM07_02155 [Elioraea sp.]|nr:hypothetical protein [Elioraea sp.]
MTLFTFGLAMTATVLGVALGVAARTMRSECCRARCTGRMREARR